MFDKNFFSKFYKAFTFFIWIIHAIISADLGIESDIFAVGQGSGVVIRDKHRGKAFIIDSGHSGSDEETIPLLKRVNNAIFGKAGSHTRLAGALFSHSDGDHIRLFTRVLNSNSRALKDQNSVPGQEVTVYLGSPFPSYCVGTAKPCLEALIAVNAQIKPLSHIMTLPGIIAVNTHIAALLTKMSGEKAYEEANRTIMTGFLPRSYFMNVLIPEFSDDTRELTLVIMVANSLYAGGTRFAGRVTAGSDNVTPGVLDEATPIVGVSAEENTVFHDGTNNNGAVVKLTYKGRRIIFPGDIDGDHCTDRLLVSVRNLGVPVSFLKADVLIAAHHGADRDRTNNASFLLMTDPSHIVVSAGALEGKYIHPRFNSLFTMAGILRLSTLRVAPHLIQCGDPTGLTIMVCPKMTEHFCLATGTTVMERGKWLQMFTQLPLYTTHTSSDVRITITSRGDFVVKES